MAYPNKDTAEFWELVASGYRQLAEHPPKFLAPGSTIEGFLSKAKEAEMEAEAIKMAGLLPMPVEFAKPTEAFEDSLIKRESEMFREKVKAVAAENRKAIERGSFQLKSLEEVRDYGEPVRVTEDLWKSVLRLD
jgi:hypothetical protein